MDKFFVVIVLALMCVGTFARSFAVLSKNDQKLVDELSSNNEPLLREKRQPRRQHHHHDIPNQQQPGGFGENFGGNAPQNYGQSSALANANAFNQYQGPEGFGASNALAGAQSFHSQGPLGGFGASAANSGSQGFNVGPNGVQGNAAFGGSQAYDLPNGHHINLAYSQGFGANNGQVSGSGSNSLTYTK